MLRSACKGNGFAAGKSILHRTSGYYWRRSSSSAAKSFDAARSLPPLKDGYPDVESLLKLTQEQKQSATPSHWLEKWHWSSQDSTARLVKESLSAVWWTAVFTDDGVLQNRSYLITPLTKEPRRWTIGIFGLNQVGVYLQRRFLIVTGASGGDTSKTKCLAYFLLPRGFGKAERVKVFKSGGEESPTIAIHFPDESESGDGESEDEDVEKELEITDV